MIKVETSYDAHGRARFRARVKVRGKYYSKVFRTSEADAIAWQIQKEAEMSSGELEKIIPVVPNLGKTLERFVSLVPGRYEESLIDQAQALRNFDFDQINPSVIFSTYPDMGEVVLLLEYVTEYARRWRGAQLAINPFAEARQIYDKLEFRPVSSTERYLLLKHARNNDQIGYFSALFSVAHDAALTQKDALDLQKSHIDTDKRALDFNGRFIPLPDATYDLIRDRMISVDTPGLFDGVSSEQSKSRLVDYCKLFKFDPTIKFLDLRKDGSYNLCLKYGFARAWDMLGRKTSANTAWLVAAVERNKSLVESIGSEPHFTS